MNFIFGASCSDVDVRISLFLAKNQSLQGFVNALRFTFFRMYLCRATTLASEQPPLGVTAEAQTYMERSAVSVVFF